MGKRNWSWGGWTKRFRGRQRRAQRASGRRSLFQSRRLHLEFLEPRQLLSGDSLSDMIASMLASMTPNPHPTGDRPSETAQMITLAAYTPGPSLPDPGISPEITAFLQDVQQIYSNILSSPQDRPSYWGEPADPGGDEYRLHLCDNGMLISQWTVNWGDGSAQQTVSNQPWVIHSYVGSPNPYAITVTASSMDGTFTSGMGDTPGALDQDFNVASSRTANWASHGTNPDWSTQLGDLGQQTTNFESNGGFDQASAEALDDGNILVVGTTANGQFGLVRYTDEPGSSNDGEPDTTFGTGGLVTTTFAAGSASASAVAVDASNSTIVVAGVVVGSNGHHELALACYNDADGSLDTSFGTGGLVTTDLGTGWTSTNAVAIESDNSILVAGEMSGHFALLHYASNGTQDTSFGGASGGIVTTSFGGTNEEPSAMALDSNGRILVAGTSTQPATAEDFALARYNANGTLDTTFGTGGLVTTDFAGGNDEATSLAIQPSDGKIILAGTSDQGGGYYTFALARYDTNGSLDNNFGCGGGVTTDFGDGDDTATGVAIQGNGQIVVSGTTLLDGSGNIDSQTHFALARYNTDGSPDTTFGSNGSGTVTTDFSTLGFNSEVSSGIMLDANGRLVVAGTATQSTYSSFAVACYDPAASSLGVQVQYDPPVLRMVATDQEIDAGNQLDLSPLGMFACQPAVTNLSYAIDWGDGSTPDTGTPTTVSSGGGSALFVGSFGGEHTYTAPGVYEVAATVTCSQGSDTQTIQVTVDAPPTFLTTSIPDATVNVGQTYTLPTIAFTGYGTYTATVAWGDGSTDNPDVNQPGFDSTQLAYTPGSLTDSYAYGAAGTYTGTITLADNEGDTVSESFNVTVSAADVALTDFSTDGHLLQVAYTISNDTSAPFQIGIYSSPDGSTPDQLLSSYSVGAIDSSELTVGNHVVSISPPAADVSGDYYLIAVADSDATPDDNTIVFDGGIFQGNDGTDYMFGTDAADTAQVQTSSLTLNSTSYLLASTPPTVHVRTEGGNDTVTVDQGVTEPLWIYGGLGNNTITDQGSGGDLLDGGSGQGVIHGGYGFNSPEIVDDSDPQATGKTAYYQETGSYSAVACGFNQGEQSLAYGSQATWTFTSLPAGYYDVYVTWSPQSGVSTAAQYVVKDNSTSINPVGQSSIATVDQTIAPADEQAAGVFWHDLGVFQVQTNGDTLSVQLTAGSTPVLADAVRLVGDGTSAPTTNLQMNSFSVDSTGQFSVSYTVSDGAVPPFSIGIYGSPDGVQPVELLQTYDVTDPTMLAVGTYTATFDPDLGGLDNTSMYLMAKLDAYDQVYETTKADNLSAALASTVFQDDNGDLYILSPGSGNPTITQDPSGNLSITGTSGSFASVGTVYVSLQSGSQFTIDSTVTASVVVYGGPGGDTITDNGSGDNTIYGGAGTNTITLNGSGNDTVYGGSGYNTITDTGSGNNTIYGGPNGNTITAGSGDDQIYGGGGTEYLYAGSGDDWIEGGSGTDYIYGSGTDWLEAGSGTDHIYGGSGTNVIRGNDAGTDYLYGGTGLNDLYSGAGTADIYGGGGADYFHLDDGSPDIFPGGGANYQIQGYGGMVNEGNNNYLPIDPISQGNVTWEFGLGNSSIIRLGESSVTPVAVYATWNPSASPGSGQWAQNACYKVYDGEGATAVLLDTINVDQKNSSPTNSLSLNGYTFQLLGVYDFSSGVVTIELCDANYQAGDKLDDDATALQVLWPKVDIQQTGVTVPTQVSSGPAGAASDYVDWYDACNPASIPVEGSGSRTQFALSAWVNPLFAQAQSQDGTYNWPPWNWTAEMPVVAGLDYWTAAQGGTQLSADENGNIELGALAPGGTYTGIVWVSAPSTVQIPPGQKVLFQVAAPPANAQVQAGAPANQVQTPIRILRNPVAAGQNERWKFQLGAALPYPVVLVQEINVSVSVVLPGPGPEHNRERRATTHFFEWIDGPPGGLQAAQTEVSALNEIQAQQTELPAPANGPNFDDTWTEIVAFPVPANAGRVTIQGQVRAFRADDPKVLEALRGLKRPPGFVWASAGGGAWAIRITSGTFPSGSQFSPWKPGCAAAEARTATASLPAFHYEQGNPNGAATAWAVREEREARTPASRWYPSNWPRPSQ